MLSQWIAPAATQQARKQQLKQWVQNGELAMVQSYLDPHQWQQFISKLEHPVQPQHWPQALNVLALPLWHDDNHHYGLVRYYADLTNLQIENITATMPQLSFFDQPKRLTASLTQVRQSLLWFFALAAAGFAVVLIARYGLKAGVAASFTVVVSALGALLVSQWLLGDLTIFNLLACLLIITLAIDYVVLFNEQGSKPHVILAILLSGISSMAAFGMMSFSQTPAVYHFGFTTLTGILLAVILAFITPLSPRAGRRIQRPRKQ
jgi:predicted exporter